MRKGERKVVWSNWQSFSAGTSGTTPDNDEGV